MKVLLLKLLIAVAGDILTKYILPLITNTKRKDYLSLLAPIAAHYVGIAERSSLRGEAKRNHAAVEIAAAAKRDYQIDVPEAYIDTAIQLAYHALGLDEK